jgi:drug/metabolite transporter (DMT)-like permease
MKVNLHKTTLYAHASMVLFSLLVAGSFPIGQVIAYQIDPIALTFLRFLLASVLLGAFLAWRGAFRSADFRPLWRFLLLGGSFSFYFIFMFEALETATPVSTSSIFTLMPFIAICLDRAFFAKRAGWPLLLSLLLGAWGALIVVFRGELSNLLALSLERGEGLFFLGTAAHAFYAVMVPKLRRGESALVFSFGVMVAATLLIFIAAPRPILALDVTQLGAPVYWSLVYLAVFASICSFSCLNYASAYLSSGQLTAYTFLTPFWVALLGLQFLEQKIAPYMMMGGSLILISLIFLLLLGRQRSQAKS